MIINLPLKTEEDRIDLLLEILSFIPPFNSLRRRERQVFAGLLRAYNKYKNYPADKRYILVFDYDTRREIAAKYGMSISSVYVCMKDLRKKRIITENSINPKFIINTDDTDQIIFNIK